MICDQEVSDILLKCFLPLEFLYFVYFCIICYKKKLLQIQNKKNYPANLEKNMN
jgi:hypothetical protein